MHATQDTRHETRRATPYHLELTRGEHDAARVMTDRGYLGELLDHATEEEWSEDGETCVLRFTESDAWLVQATCDDDPYAVWALTTPRTSLGQKFARFLDAIV